MSNKTRKNLWAVILAGGSGKRLWPLSRGSYPKQFIDIDNSGSLLSNSITRASNLSNLRGILIVAGQNHLKLVENTLKEFKDLNCLVLIEPEGRNTAPAIFAATKYIQKQDKESEILVIPSDHHYEQDVLSRTVDNAMKVKQKINLSLLV